MKIYLTVDLVIGSFVEVKIYFLLSLTLTFYYV